MNRKLIESTVLKLFSEAKQEQSDLNIDIITKISKDIDINSALNKIERNVAGRDYFVKTSRKDITAEQIEKVENLFFNIKFNRIFNYILKARIFGYYCFEIVYNEDYSVNTLIPIPHESISYKDQDKKWIIKAGNEEIEITHDKFLLCIHKWLPNKVKGESIFESCNSSFLDKELFRNQLRGIAKKYGETVIMFGYDPEEDEEETKERARALKEAQGKTAIGIPIERMGAGEHPDLSKSTHIIRLSDLNPMIYTELEDKEKTKLIQNILGSTLTMEVGKTGTQALGTIHMEAEEQVVDECCAFISDSLQNLLNTVCPLHGLDSQDYYFSLEKKRDIKKELEVQKEEEGITSTKIDNMSKLATNGYELSREYIAKYLGIDEKYLGKKTTIEFASKKKDLNSLLELNRSAKKKVLEQAENAFLEKFTKEIKKQIQEWSSNITESNIIALNLNFNTFNEHQTIIELMARIKLYKENSTIEFEEEINPFELKFEDAIKFALDKNPLLFDKIDEITETVRANAFWVKRLTELNAVEKLMKELQVSIEAGGTFKDWLKNIDEVINKAGLGKNGWYLENVYRTNSMSFYNAGAYKEQEGNIESQPYGLYDGVGDDKQTSICKELDGKVYALDDPIWDNIYPPNHYQCRSGVLALSTEEAEEFGLVVSSPSVEIKNLNLGTFKGNPGKNYFKNLEKAVKDKESSNGN